MDQSNRSLRSLFWILLGFLSTFFAEVLSGSAPDFFFKGFGYFGIFPIYFLHSLLLVALVIGRRKPFSLRTLYFAGLLFGMYEAYITKVLWEPLWNEEALKAANVAVFETLMLVPGWHALFSFILPLFWIEGLGLASNHLTGMLPGKWHNRLISYPAAVLMGLIGGVMSGRALGDPWKALFLILADCLIMTLMLVVWRLVTRSKRLDLADLLPQKYELLVLGILMVGDYLILSLTIRREVRPGIMGHLAVLLLYALIALLIYLSMRKDRLQGAVETVSADNLDKYNFKHWLVFCLWLLASALFVNFLPEEIRELAVGVVILAVIGCGLWILISCLRDLARQEWIM